MDKSKPFGLVIPKKTKLLQVKKTSIFDSDSDDEPARKKPIPIPQAKPLSKKLEQKELCDDPSIYEYDSIYDDMKAQEVSKIAGPKDNKPSRYIDTLLKAADKRKKEYERRVERKVQVEREKEGDEFKDKEAFVTSSYKKKMQEMEEAEERERRENMMNDMMDVTKQNDLSGFYRHFLKQSVGEEKVPVFGDKRAIKDEPESDNDSKTTDSSKGKKRKNIYSDEKQDSDLFPRKEKENDMETKCTSGTIHNRPPKMYRKGRSDSDDEESQNPSKTSNLPDPNLDDDSDIVSSCEEEEEGNLIKSVDVSLKDKISVKNSKSIIDNEEDSSKHKKIAKNIRKRTNEDSSDSSESSKENDENQDVDLIETSSNIPEESQTKDPDKSKSLKPKRKNWLEKRTVGEIFAAAQARYFQRLAARNG